ncbi:MAG: hypothetical protein ACRDK7_00780 [Solirubrobacteraceae bacterium]
MKRAIPKSIRGCVIVVAVALAAPLATMGLASPALAAPEGEYAVFADCPLSNAEVNGCIVAKTESGEFVIGTHKTRVPIEKTITLQGGFEEEIAAEFHEPFVEAADGNTLSKTPQNVPGGLLGIKCEEIANKYEREACEAIVKSKLLAVTATTELALPTPPASLSSIFLSEASLVEPILYEAYGIPALGLPVKVKLENPLLGNECYIGSGTEPIVLKLTTGATNPPAPNTPIMGKIGKFSSRAEGGILVISKNSLVDNLFAVPVAKGCGGKAFESIIDPIVNAKLGLPSPAGNNTAILNGTLEQAGAEAARESEES